MFVGVVKIQAAESQDGSRFKCKLVCARETCAQFAGPVAPGDLQSRDVATIDLRQTRVMLPEGISAVIAPVAIRGRLRSRAHIQTQKADQRQQRCAQPPRLKVSCSARHSRIRGMRRLSVIGGASHTPCWYSCEVNQSRAVRPRITVRGVFFAFVCFAAANLALARDEASAEPAAAQPNVARPRIGLVLSGGGARGAAHIGVLKVLDDLHVPIDAIAGTSMGAVVGGLYASGFSARDIESIMTSVNWQDAFRDRPPRTDLTFAGRKRRRISSSIFRSGCGAATSSCPRGSSKARS